MDEEIVKNLMKLRDSRMYRMIEEHPEMDDQPLEFLESMVRNNDKNLRILHLKDVNTAMTWKNTPQGYPYWHKVMNIVFNKNF